jgi:hypothetical protein
MTDPRIPTGLPEHQPARPNPPQHDQDQQARQRGRALTAGAWLPGARGGDRDDDC